MQVTQYTYQSPHTSPVQFGRADPSSQKQESQAQTQELPDATNETLTRAKEFTATQTQEVEPTVNASKLDFYA